MESVLTWLLGLLGMAAAGLGYGLWRLRRTYLVITITGPSMLPTYADGDRVLVRRVPSRQIQAGEVVVAEVVNRAAAVPSSTRGAWIPVGAQSRLIGGPRLDRVVKRVAAVAGDRVPSGVDAPDDRVPAGSLVLLGDNPADSADSRSYGYVPVDQIVGVVLRRLH